MGIQKTSQNRIQNLTGIQCAFVLLVLFLSISLPGFSARSEKIPAELENVGIDEHLGNQVDLNLQFQDESGKSVALKNYVNGQRPLLLAFVYFDCPNLCTMVLNSMIDSMKQLAERAQWVSGKQFDVLAVSFDPRDTPAAATAKKEAYMKAYGNPGGGSNAVAGWHFLVGKQPEITALTNQLGFKYKWDKNQNQFAHVSALMVLTPEGKISRYFYGIDYPENDVRVALLEASHGKIGSIVDKFLMFCYHYDASAKKYVVLASRIMTAGGGLMVAILGIFFFLVWMKERHLNLESHLKGG